MDEKESSGITEALFETMPKSTSASTSLLALVRSYVKSPVKFTTAKIIPLEMALNKFGRHGHWKTRHGFEQFIYAGNIQEIRKRIELLKLYDKERQCLKKDTANS